VRLKSGSQVKQATEVKQTQEEMIDG